MCAPGRAAGSAWSMSFEIAFQPTVSSVMKRCHSVVLRSSDQNRFGYESAAYSGSRSEGTSWL